MPLEAEIIFLAIRGALRLGATARKIYVESTQAEALVLPLADFGTQADEFRAFKYFTSDPAGLARATAQTHARLHALVGKIQAAANDVHTLTAPEKAELRALFRDNYQLDHPPAGYSPAELSEYMAFATVRQWRAGQNPNPTWAQRLAGSLIETGVDYLRTCPPEALRPGSKYERVATGLLDALEGLALGDATRAEWAAVPARLLTAALGAVADAPELFTSDPALQELAKLAGQSILTNVQARLDRGVNSQEAERISVWAERVLHGVLATAGTRALADPGKYLGIQHATTASAVSKVGSAMLSLVLDQPATVSLDALTTRNGLSRVLDAALEVVAEHPEAVGADGAALRGLVAQIAGDLQGVVTRIPGDILPEVARIILLRTGENLPLLWPASTTSPGRNLALAAAQAVLAAATTPPAQPGRWQPRFSQLQLLDLVDSVLRQLSANPGWLVDRAGQLSPDFGVAVGAIFASLRDSGDARLSPEFALELVRTGLAAVVLRPDFVRTKVGNRPFVAALLESTLRIVLDPQLPPDDVPAALGRLVRDDAIPRLWQEVLSALQTRVLNDARLTEFTAVLGTWLPRLAAGAPLEWPALARDLEQRFTH